MFRIATCIALCCLAANGQPPTAEPASAVPINPGSLLAPGRHPLGPGYNRPYYNPSAAIVPILSYSNNRGIDGSYSYSFATGDGKQAQESGFLKDAYIDNTGEPQGTQVVEGSYSYISPEGTPIEVHYIADENGFRPSGVHIPADGKGALQAGSIGSPLGSLGSHLGNLGSPLTPLGHPLGQPQAHILGALGGHLDPLGRHIGTPGQVYDPRYNANYPFNYRHPYNAPYNHLRPFDVRHPYDGRHNTINPYLPPAATPSAVTTLAEKEEAKKESD